jgi:hypothetical protein
LNDATDKSLLGFNQTTRTVSSLEVGFNNGATIVNGNATAETLTVNFMPQLITFDSNARRLWNRSKQLRP